MAFYDLSKEERIVFVERINAEILEELISGQINKMRSYFADDDTYVRKSAYLVVGKLYLAKPDLQEKIIRVLELFAKEEDFKVRQTSVNAGGEVGKKDFEKVQHFFDESLFDTHHSVRNAVIGSMKKMGEVNPKPVLAWSKKYLHHEDKEIRREICHGIELRGRTHPQDILPLLRELQHDKTARVRNTLVHVLGQIAYKKGCLETVLEDLKTWENKKLVQDALAEIIDVHDRYKNFSVKTQKEAIEYIEEYF